MAASSDLFSSVDIKFVLVTCLCVILGLALLLRGSGTKDESRGAEKTTKENKKNKNKKAKDDAGKSGQEGEAEDTRSGSRESQESLGKEQTDEGDGKKKKKNKKNKKKNKKNKSKNKNKKVDGDGGDAGGQEDDYVPTEEDLRKRQERAAKRKQNQQQKTGKGSARGTTTGGDVDRNGDAKHGGEHGVSKAAKKAAKSRGAGSDAGRITKVGIVGLSREMTAEEKNADWTTIGNRSGKGKGKKTKAKIQTSSEPNARVVVIPTAKIGMIIGAGGLTLRKIEAETGCNISMPQQNADAKPTKTTKVTIRCDDEDGLREAAECVMDLATRGHSDLIYRGTDSKHATFRLSPSLHHLLVGKDGVTIRAIQAKSKCKIVLPSDKTSSKITVIGESPGVKLALEALKQIQTYSYSSIADSSLTHEEIELSPTEIGYVIGHRGNTIKSIQGDTHTRINTPGPGRKNRNVVVVGTAPNIARALKQIRRAIDRNTY